MPNLESYHFYKPFTTTIAGFVIPMMTGLLSACSSGLIIYIISKSQQKLSTTYHRIMAFMSVFDILSSLFIALGTIMMPSDCIFKFAGPMLGNKVTCQIQGWFTTFGFAGTTALNTCLSWYFVCNIAFKFGSNAISRWIEPLMYLYVMSIALLTPNLYLSKDLLNPNYNYSFCTIASYPKSCDYSAEYRWYECEREERDKENFYKYTKLSVYDLAIKFLLIVVGTSIILWTVYQNSKEIKKLIINDDDGVFQNSDDVIAQNKFQLLKDLRYSRVLIFQSLMYVAVFLLTWSPISLMYQFNTFTFGLQVVTSIFFPIQGFWNLLIFLYDKSFLIRQKYHHMGFLEALRRIISSPSDVPTILLSNLTSLTFESIEEEHVQSQLESAFDGLSSLRDQQMSVAGSSSDVSEEISTDSALISLENASRTNFVSKFRS